MRHQWPRGSAQLAAPSSEAARGGRCPTCRAHLVRGGRYCPACGASILRGPLTVDTTEGNGPATATAEIRSPRPTIIAVLAFVALSLVVVWLAWGRSGEDARQETTADGTTTTTEPVATTTTTPRRTTTEAPAPTTTAPPPAPSVVDVSTVPADLTDLTLIVLDRDYAAALDLGTGELTPFDAPEAPYRTNVWLRATPVGILEVSFNSADARLIDWDLQESDRFSGGFWPGEAVIGDEEIWFMSYEDAPEIVRMDASGEVTSVAELPESGWWFDLVGSSGEAPLVSSSTSGRVHRVERDGTITVAYDGVAFGGGSDWLLVPDCDDQLRCSALAVDLRTGARLTFGGSPFLDHGPEMLSADGRRALVNEWSGFGEPTGWIIDVDAGTVIESSVTVDFDQTTADPDLRYLIHPSETLVRFQELTTGEETVVELPQEISHVVVAPDGWVAPTG